MQQGNCSARRHSSRRSSRRPSRHASRSPSRQSRRGSGPEQGGSVVKDVARSLRGSTQQRGGQAQAQTPRLQPWKSGISGSPGAQASSSSWAALCLLRSDRAGAAQCLSSC